MTRRMARKRQGLATKKPPQTQELEYPRARAKRAPYLTGEGR
jgi:hypothetical protein